MTKTFLIGGEIVSKDADKLSYEDVCPSQIDMFLKGLKPEDDVVFEFNSCGGDVYAGLAIANLIKNCGHKTTARVISIAASIASVIAASCDKMEIAENAFFMMHLPWTMTCGNANDLAKEIQTLDQCKKALIATYKSVFPDKDEAYIEQLMVDETWILGSQAETFGLKCEVIPSAKEYKIAASIKDRFNKIPKGLIMENEIKEEETKTEVVAEVKEEQTAEVKDEVKEQPKAEVEMVTKAEADSRVSGMQSAMAKQIDSLKKDYDAKISEFENQLRAKDEELNSVKAEFTSLTTKLEETSKELQTTASALEEKTNALAMLNANVNTPNDTLPSFKDGLAKCTTLKERVDFIKSGKYTN